MSQQTLTPLNWLMFLPQVPTDQPAVRVRVWRRLQRLGAIALKSGAHLLPNSSACLEALHWLAGELAEAGCEVTIARCELVYGVNDAALREQFNQQRNEEYDSLIRQLQEDSQSATTFRLAQREGQLAKIQERDYFDADRAGVASQMLAALQTRARGDARPSARMSLPESGTVWVTRKGVKVDRIASAWLIRRFIDSNARFRFLDAAPTTLPNGEVGFDMMHAQYTHKDGLCTFEYLLTMLSNTDQAVRLLAEMVHDLDLKDERYGHAETAGLGVLMEGVIHSTEDDLTRIERGSGALDVFLAGLGKRG